MIRDLIFKNRSYRRFYENEPMTEDLLRELVGLARLCPSAANRQPLKFILSCDPKTNALIFPHLRWAGYLKGWGGPKEGERPSAYIVILGDTGITNKFFCDDGIAAQSMLLGAVERGFGGCMLASIDKDGLRKALKINPKYEILLVVALGKPKEKVAIEDIKNGDIKYWRDEQGVHHVPKRRVEELIIKLRPA